MTVSALLTSGLILLFVLSASSDVDPSTCRTIWMFKLPCSKAVGDLVNQVNTWSVKKQCDSQEKCMYEIIKEFPTYLQIMHTSPRTGKITKIIFEFNPPAAPFFCKITARSVTVFQNTTGPNDYCLLYNLIDGSGLTRAKGYKEICNMAMCPSKESATCDTHE